MITMISLSPKDCSLQIRSNQENFGGNPCAHEACHLEQRKSVPSPIPAQIQLDHVEPWLKQNGPGSQESTLKE